MLGRDALIERIRRARGTGGGTGEPAKGTGVDLAQDPVSGLVARIEHLEKLVQGLQDSVHRESSRQAKRIADLEARLQPGTLSKALDEDARARGL